MARDTRDQVAKLLEAGLSRAEIARRLGITRATVTYHAKRLGAGVDTRCARRYDWAEIQRFYDEGHTVRECLARFGCSSKTWHDARLRGDLTTRDHRMPIEVLLDGSRRNRTHVKTRLRQAGLIQDQCSHCGLTSWQGRPIVLQLHHINGDPSDQRLENLELVCPNCHSQTENFSGRNKGRASTRNATTPVDDEREAA